MKEIKENNIILEKQNKLINLMEEKLKYQNDKNQPQIRI